MPASLRRFTERTLHALELAAQRAAEHGDAPVDTPHIAVGLILESEGLASYVLATLMPSRIGLTSIERFAIHGQSGAIKGLYFPDGRRIPCTARAERACELALREADSLGHSYIGTEHVLLALARLDDEGEEGFLTAVGLEPDEIRDAVLRTLTGPPRSRAAPSRRAPTTDLPRPVPSQQKPEGDRDEPERLQLEAVPTHADRPADHDALGRLRLAEVLGERIRRVRGEDTETPVRDHAARRRKLRLDRTAAKEAKAFMIHVHAPWGAGKSSLLNFLAQDLRNRPKPLEGRLARAYNLIVRRRAARDPRLSQWVVVEFSAWEHQRLDPPWWWLLAALRRASVRELWWISRPRWLWFWVRDIAWRLWNARLIWITACIVAALVFVAEAMDWFGLKGSSLQTVKTTTASVAAVLALGTTLWTRVRGTSRWLAFGSADGAAKFLRRAHDPLGVYRRRFRSLVRATGRPIAVFIDDLDRCSASYVVELLEGIQTLFVDQPVTYVIAADRQWLCDSFAAIYEDFSKTVGDAGRTLGFLFLEKTFQVSMEIPPMSFEQRREYWESLALGAQSPASGHEPSTADPAGEICVPETASLAELEAWFEDTLSSNADDASLRHAVRRLNSPELQAQLRDFLREFAPLLENNPRAMKRLMNAYGIERDRLVRERRLPSADERRQLVLFTILRLRWPLFAEHLLRHPEDVALFHSAGARRDEHPFRTLFSQRDVCALFDASLVDVALDATALDRFAGREPAEAPSVGA